MTFVQELTQKLDQFLQNEENIFCKALAKIESLTGISRLYLANSLIVTFIAYMIFGQFAQLICNTIGFIYPAYASLIALDSPQTDDISQIQQLLRYWVVFAFMSVGDFFSGSLFRIIPFYWLSKMSFLVWCIAPIENNGSNFLYFKFIQPVFKQVQPIIDGYISGVVSKFDKNRKD